MKNNFSKTLATILLMGGFTSLAHADLVCVNTSGSGCSKPVVPVKLAPVGEVVTETAKPAEVTAPAPTAVASVARPSAPAVAPVASVAAQTPAPVAAPAVAPVAAPAAAPTLAATQAPVAVAAVEPTAKKALSHWEIRANDLSIYSALKRWSDEAGWQLSWEIPVDYPVSIVGSFDNNFRGAVDSVVEAYRDSDYAPKGCFYENNVLRIVRRVGDGKECLVSGQ